MLHAERLSNESKPPNEGGDYQKEGISVLMLHVLWGGKSESFRSLRFEEVGIKKEFGSVI